MTTTNNEPVKARARTRREIIGDRPVVPATESLHLNITKATVEKSLPQNQCYCVVASALRDETPGLEDVIVTRSRAWVVLKDRAIQYELPKSTSDQVKRYDETGEWVPGEYRLKAPRPSISGRKSKPSGSSRKGITMPARQRKNRGRAVALEAGSLKRNAMPV